MTKDTSSDEGLIGDRDTTVRNLRVKSLRISLGVNRCAVGLTDFCLSVDRIVMEPCRRTAIILVLNLLFCACTFAAMAKPANENRLPTLHFAKEIRQLAGVEADDAYPVELTGVVVYFDPQRGHLFVHDTTAFIFVKTASLPGTNFFRASVTWSESQE